MPKKVDVAKTDNTGCQHHWDIESATGPTSKGECRLCNTTRTFRNYFGSIGNWQEQENATHRLAPAHDRPHLENRDPEDDLK
jgi:hypothetical protein